MKKFVSVLAVLFVVLIYSSCTSRTDKSVKQEGHLQDVEFRESLTHEDTIQMLNLSDQCMELLKNKDIDGAIAMLHEYNGKDSTVTSLSQDSRRRIRRQFEMFPVLRYQRDYFSFIGEGVNDVRYLVWFAEEKDPALHGNPIIKFMFNPVCINHTWYLCVKDQNQESDEIRR